MTRPARRKRNSQHAEAIKGAAVWSGALLVLIGIIVAQSAETIKTGYQISALNSVWQEKNFEHMTMAKKINSYTASGKVDKFVEQHFNLRRVDPGKIVFIHNAPASK